MKKVLATGVALLMAGSIATAAEMDDNSGVKITGNARARVIYKDKEDFGNSDDDANITMDSRVRFEVRGTSAGGSYVHGRIRLAEEKFNGATDISADDNIYVDKAYIGIPFNDAFTLEAGKYRSTYGNGFVYDDMGLAGFKGIYAANGIEVFPFFEVQSEGQVSDIAQDVSEDNDAYRMGAAITVSSVENWTFGAIAAFDTDDRVNSYVDADGATVETGDGNSDGFWGSVFFNGTMAGFGIEGEFAFAENGVVLDEVQGSGDDDAWGGYIRGSYTMDALTLALDLGFTKDGFVADDDQGFVMIGAGEPITKVLFGEGGFDNYWAGLRAGYAVTEALTLTGNLVYLDADGNDGTASDESRLYDMVEVSGVLEYAVSKGCTFSWYAGYLAPSFDGRLNAAGVEEDGYFGTYAMLEVKF